MSGPAHLSLGRGPEFDRIRAILKRLGATARGIGDDCAVLSLADGWLAVSTDLSVERVHFRRDWLTAAEIGWRSAAAALSDLAAEGAEPIGLLASVGVPKETPEAELVALMEGVGAAADSVGAAVVGGDLSTAAEWVVNITVIGRAQRPVTRSGARPGDGLWVTGTLGGARAALERWRAGVEPEAEARRAFAHPEPRIAMGRALAAAGAVALIDLSDGLAGDAQHLAAASNCGLELTLERVPVAVAAVAAAGRVGLAPAQFAALGGEDYELLAALPTEFGEAQAAALAREHNLSLTRIGQVLAGAGVRSLLDGHPIELQGFNHFT